MFMEQILRTICNGFVNIFHFNGTKYSEFKTTKTNENVEFERLVEFFKKNVVALQVSGIRYDFLG